MVFRSEIHLDANRFTVRQDGRKLLEVHLPAKTLEIEEQATNRMVCIICTNVMQFCFVLLKTTYVFVAIAAVMLRSISCLRLVESDLLQELLTVRSFARTRRRL